MSATTIDKANHGRYDANGVDLAEADDILDLIVRGEYDFAQATETVISDLLKIAALCDALRWNPGKKL